MKIETHISQLLYRYQCVTVPGFGAFLTELQSSSWNEYNQTFSPPKKLVMFNSFLQNNDGLLANYISSKEKISYEEALTIIQSNVNHWKNNIIQQNNVVLNEIGIISVNAEGSIVFEAQNQINYNAAAFGMKPIVSTSISREESISLDLNTQETEPVEITKSKTKNYNFIKYAAAIAVALGLSGNYAYQSHITSIENQTSMIQKEVQEEVQNKIQEATFFIQNPLPQVTLTVKEEKLNYHIVAGAFRDEQNAENIYQKLSKDGFKSRRLKQNKHGLYPVLYGSYTTYLQSQEALKEIKKTHNPDAWILIQEL